MKAWISGLILVGSLVTPGLSLAYPIDHEFNANNCEFYVDSLSIGNFRYLGTEERVLEALIHVHEEELVNAASGEILTVGAFINTRQFIAKLTAEGQPQLKIVDEPQIVAAPRLYDSTYQVRFVYEKRREPQLTFTELNDFAFFLDLKHPDGKVVRLWQRDSGNGGFTMSSVFGEKPGFISSVGVGVLSYPDTTSRVYHQKTACTGS